MKLRYFYFAAAVIFAAVAFVEFVHAQNITAGVVNGVTAAIFLFLGISPQRKR